MKTIYENGKLFKIVEVKEEIDLDLILKENEELKEKLQEINSVNRNSGSRNSGSWNSGNRNSGKWNSGSWNSGDRNSGDWNSGDRNSGSRNSGRWNSGDRNSGNRNSGRWNSGDRNSGYFNLNEPKIRIFGKETDIKKEYIKFPNFLYFSLTEWIEEENMTEEEKKNNPNYKTNNGYLKIYDYKEAFQKSYNNLNEEEKIKQTKQLKELPNWNPDIFFEISGIRIN